MKLARDDWPRLLALLEQALELPVAEREAWLRGLDLSEALKAHLQGLLADRRAIETGAFLDALPAVAEQGPDAARRGRLVAGGMVGPYRLLRELGQGGMSTVWLAERADEQLRRRVALKLPHAGPGQKLLARRALRERDILAGLEHPNIARLYDVGVSESGMPFLVMEFVEGVDLLAWADAHASSLRQRLVLFQQVLRAVQYAHGKLVLHRDLKPSNILVNAAGEVKLLDFGIARVLVAEGDSHDVTELTRAAGQPLTLMYASPEQVRGMPLTTASDVYALGVVLYELACGLRPYELKAAATAGQVEDAVLHQEPRAPSRRASGARTAQPRRLSAAAHRKMLEGDLDAIALKALSKKTETRYTSVEALNADVARWLAGDPVAARTPSAWYYLRKFVERHRWSTALGTAAVCGLVAVSSVALWQSRSAREEAVRATAVRDFMLDVFNDTDPDLSRGQEPTARALLAKGRERAARSLTQTPALRAELLLGIAKAQGNIGDRTGADETITRVVALYEGLKDDKPLLMALLTQADNALAMNHVDNADALLKRAETLAARFERDKPLVRRLAQIQGFVALHRQQWTQARVSFEKFMALTESLPVPSAPEDTLDVLLGLARANSALGHRDAALALLQRATDFAHSHATLPPSAAMGVVSYRLSVEYEWGRYADIHRWLPAAIRSCAESLGGSSSTCTDLTAQLQRAWLKMGMTQQAVTLNAALLPVLALDVSPRRQLEAAVTLSRTLAFSGQIALRPDLPRQLERVGLSGPENSVSASYKLLALNTLAEVLLASGQPREALSWVRRADELALAADLQQSREARKTRLFEGVARQSLGMHAEALSSLAYFCAAPARAPSAARVLDHLFSLNCASSLRATGQLAAAIALLEQALPVLQEAMGQEAPVVQRAQRLMDDLRRPPDGTGQDSKAAALFS